MLIITDELAQRLELAEAADAADCAEAACSLDPTRCASVASVAGGYLTFCGPSSPLTHAIGVGMTGPVSIEQLDEIEEFFASRDAPVSIDVTPHTDPALHEMLSDRDYKISEFSNVLVRAVRPDEPAPQCPSQARVREARQSESELYARTVVSGFLSRQDLNDEELIVGRILFGMPHSKPFFAEVEGEIAGGCGLSVRGGVASCFGDSTLPVFRGRGVHTAMICARIAEAISAGCDIMTAGTQPGSASQRNYQRLGFTVAYSKVTMVLE
jgi:GNAT superfamily N-acetyltransferase